MWVIADNLSGSGRIEARGGNSIRPEMGSGGGGAIAIEYGEIDEEIVNGLKAGGGHFAYPGGAGTVYLRGPEAVHGDLIVDNAGLDGGWTILPVLGAGTALGGSGGVTLVTDLDRTLTPFFAGHWVVVEGPDGATQKGVWQVVQVDGFDLTLEPGAEVGEGDRWRGLYRFDAVTVTGGAKLRLDDLDDFASVALDPDSELELGNHGPPRLVPESMFLYAANRRFMIGGIAGAITDPDGIRSAVVKNQTTGYGHWMHVWNDGSLRETPIEGSSGDEVWVTAEDSHRNPLQSEVEIGTLPPNLDAPTIDPDGVSIVIRPDLFYYVEGLPGSVVDSEYSLRLTLTNVNTGRTWEDLVSEGEGFLMIFSGTPGDEIQLTVEDGHPETAMTTLNLGSMPDLRRPTIKPERILASAKDGRFWLSSEEPSIWDDGEIVEAYAFDISDVGTHYPLNIQLDGVLAASPVTNRTGAILQLVVRDAAGNKREALLLPGLPGNDGPPEIDSVVSGADCGDAGGYSRSQRAAVR